MLGGFAFILVFVIEKAWLAAFGVSLTIETTQLIVDLLYNANRVFEIDDLWTNSLGAC